MVRLALFEPEIAPNVGAAIRLCACLGVGLDVIEPCGFPWKQREIARVALDYGGLGAPVRHPSFAAFRAVRRDRLILLTTKGDTCLYDAAIHPADTFLMGRESSGVPNDVWETADLAIRIPLAPKARSLNVVTAAAIALGEAIRQAR